MLLSYFIGQKNYPVRYDLKTIGLYTFLAAALFLISLYIPIGNSWGRMACNTVLLAVYVAVLVRQLIQLNTVSGSIKRFFRKKQVFN
jgi:hypothetical protein